MRKQTKLVAVLSTAALLALGASMSSFAATGWQEENGTWVYYDKNGDAETEKWEKSGDNWFYLNEDGEMTTDAIVEHNDNYYYVDENGAMAVNKWISVENDNYDGDDDNEPVNNWYYFGNNGKAYKSSENKPVFKTINGKKYIFNSDGKMQYGWVDEDGEKLTADDAWKEGLYYCGGENDGAQATGWVSLDIVADDDEYGDKFSSLNVYDDENQTRWFYFKSNGKKISDKKAEGINGKKYSFDVYGRMNSEWVIYDASPSTVSQGTPSYTEKWRYYGTPEDGARVTKGWFKVVPDEYLNTGDYNDDSDAWYYSDKDGKLVASEIKTISSKKYAFDAKGKMKSGLKFIQTNGNEILDIADDDITGKRYDTGSDFKESAPIWIDAGYQAYYFGGGEDGSMKTGKQSVTIDGDSFTFLFNKSGGNKGVGKTGVDSSKIYLAGILLTADKDDKYAVVKESLVKGKTVYEMLTTDEFLEETVVSDVDKTKKGFAEWYAVTADANYKLINTSGSIQKNKSKAKDGNDYCYKLKGEVIEADRKSVV